ncbi:armadillo repeat protein [Biscogniauxia mediterranea]|nr:armadillo repeat protein [Biscogniauxia mediterranea]
MELESRSLLAQLAANTTDRIAALRYLKNDVIGHVQKKEQWVRQGVLPPIVSIVASGDLELSGKETPRRFLTLPALTDEDTAKLQALQLLASFASAGPTFLQPLHASGVLPAVLSSSCLQNEHPDIVLAALRVIRDIADAAAFAAPTSPINTSTLADAIFANNRLESLSQILTQQKSTRDSEAQVSIVAYLIRNLCREERHQTALVNAGILDALATRLASFVVAEGQVLPRAEVLGRAEGLADYIPEPATSTAGLGDVLGAIATIISDSPFRTCKLLYSPSILAIFPNIDFDLDRYSRTPPGSLALPGLKPTKQKEFEFMDLLLPDISSQPRSQTPHTSFPPLGTSSSNDNPSPNGRPSSKLQTSQVSWTSPEEIITSNNKTEKEDAESPLIPWLINLVRTRNSNEIVMAASVLTSLFKAGFCYKTRESTLSLLVVPILLSMLRDLESKTKDVDYRNITSDTASKLKLVEEIPAVLACLITDSEPLQKAAFDCDAVETLSKLLKASYDAPPPAAELRPWSPQDVTLDLMGDLPPERQLGEPGQHRQLVHRIRVRENTLKAIGALATSKEEYRKEIINEDIVPYVVESLSESPGKPKQPKDRVKSDAGAGGSPSESPLPEIGNNPITVIIAACYTIRMLSRSVNILRTTLVDHVVSEPLFQLLRHPNIDVQVAATASMINLVPDFSPMRESLVEAGIMKVLCEHAKSVNSSLRLNALWALKHLVDFANIDLKKRCVEELNSGWLVKLIRDDIEDDAMSLDKTRNERSAVHALDDMDEDMDMGIGDDQSRNWLSSSFYRTPHTSRAQTESRVLQLANERLAALREAELNPIRKARHDDLAIQEQGLGFIRNLICGAHSSNGPDTANDTSEMIDYLFSAMGQDELFRILASKLRVRVLQPYSRHSTLGSEARVLPPQAKIIESVIYTLVHIAASIPRHRQLVIAQTELLIQLAKLFNSQDREVRVALCHLINNLTWQDDITDAPGCSQRAVELRKLGFLSKLEALGQSDDELDVRERAKSALWQMKHGH